MGAILAALSVGLSAGFVLIPLALTIAAIVDVVRTGASLYWLGPILMFPVVGAVAYFVIERLLGGGVSVGSALATQRRTARTHLADLALRAGHWRGPHLLAEMADCHATLGQYAEAERLHREALDGEPADVDIAYGLAKALDNQGKHAEAAAILEPLCAANPRLDFGGAGLILGRCLDETGRSADAETVLRQALEKYTFVEARVRLARLLVRRGETVEAHRLLDEVATEASGLPRFARRQQWPWIVAASGLRRGKLRLPTVVGLARQQRLYRSAVRGAGALAVVAVVGCVVGYAVLNWSMASSVMAVAEESEALAALDTTHPSRVGPDLDLAELTVADVDRYIAARQGLEPTLRRWSAARLTQRRRFSDAGVVSSLVEAVGMTTDDDLSERAELAAAVVASLTAVDLGPTELGRLAELVEWRYLGRDDAILFGVPTHQRDPSARDRATIARLEEYLAQFPAASDASAEAAAADYQRQSEAELANARLRVAEADLAARANVALTAATRAACDGRRAELEALAADAVPLVWELVERRYSIGARY